MLPISNLNHVQKPVSPDQKPPLWAMYKFFNFYLDELKPLIIEKTQQPLDGEHGLNTHTNAVVFRGIDYSIHLGKDPLPVVFACAFHDIARTHDGLDTEHGKKAIPIAMKILNNFPNTFDTQTRLSILSAVVNHTTGQVASDYIAACLWDADRTRMSWNHGFDEKFFNTLRGKYAAQHPKGYIEFQREVFSSIDWSKQY